MTQRSWSFWFLIHFHFTQYWYCMFSGNEVTCFEKKHFIWWMRCCYNDVIPYWHLHRHPGRNRYGSERVTQTSCFSVSVRKTVKKEKHLHIPAVEVEALVEERDGTLSRNHCTTAIPSQHTEQCIIIIKAQNPLDKFPCNFPIDEDVANLLSRSRRNGILENNTTQQTQRTFARANLLQTCYVEATGKLV